VDLTLADLHCLPFFMLNGQVSVGNNTLVKRFMRGIFLLKPSLPSYNFTWDVSIFLNYLQTLSNDSLPLETTLQLCALLSLLTAQRLQYSFNRKKKYTLL
jgi:hypothetical protein